MSKNHEPPRYGGRALRNGVMMVGPGSVAVAVRRPNGEIASAVEAFHLPSAWSRNIPFVRGLVSFAGMLKLARTAGKLEGRLNEGGSRVKANLPQLAPGIGAALADRLTRELSKRSDARLVVPIETVAGVALPFLAFGLSSRVPGVRELWRYHGAEHKAVNAAEAGLELTSGNAAAMSRIHPRCGTVFAFWGLLGGTLAKIYLSSLPSSRRKAVAGALSGPLVLSTAYEAVRLGYRFKDNPIARLLFTPAWQSQRFTTAEPDEQELEVAVASLQAVIDYERGAAEARADSDQQPSQSYRRSVAGG
ncbi:MAG TPA: DUF1385 domain-containing protein [Chloroflexota bacterium]|nr:DUF1385 domain-containing protein [Chloroflexota bacterium]